MQLFEDFTNLQARPMFGAFETQFKEQAVAAKTDVDKLRNLIRFAHSDAAGSNLKSAVSHYQKLIDKADSELKAVGEFRDGKWCLRAGASQSGLTEAVKNYDTASTEFSDFLSGAKKYKTAGNIEVEVSKDLKNAYLDAKKSVGEAQGIMDGMFGRLRVNGISAEGIKKTAQHNYEGAKFWTSKFWKEGTNGTRGVAFARVGGVSAGAAMTIDALVRGKDSAGEDRSWVVRVGEGAAGLGLGAASVLAGKAR